MVYSAITNFTIPDVGKIINENTKGAQRAEKIYHTLILSR